MGFFIVYSEFSGLVSVWCIVSCVEQTNCRVIFTRRTAFGGKSTSVDVTLRRSVYISVLVGVYISSIYCGCMCMHMRCSMYSMLVNAVFYFAA